MVNWRKSITLQWFTFFFVKTTMPENLFRKNRFMLMVLYNAIYNYVVFYLHTSLALYRITYYNLYTVEFWCIMNHNYNPMFNFVACIHTVNDHCV